jgi:hypothetical protein
MSFALIKARASAVGFEESYIELAVPTKLVCINLFGMTGLWCRHALSHVFVYVYVCARAHPFVRIISEGVDGLTDV